MTGASGHVPTQSPTCAGSPCCECNEHSALNGRIPSLSLSGAWSYGTGRRCRFRSVPSSRQKESPPETATGMALLVAEPLPSAPGWPQQYAAPPVVTPHVKSVPALTLAKESPPETARGVRVGVVVEPMPTWPYWLLPQQ